MLFQDGTLLVDGGYMNVLPADVMKKQMQARTVIAVDVSQEVVLDNYEYGSHLNVSLSKSGAEASWKRS